MGSAGSKGDTGDKGQQGLKGDTGPHGLKGDIGPQGLKGEQGPKGDTGSKGQDGVLSLDSLSTTQFDKLLKAILEDSRSKGPIGPTGPTGPKGDTGLTGVVDTTKSYTFTQPQNFGDINVSGKYNMGTSRGTELFLRPDTDDYALLTTKADFPGGSHFNINPVFGGNVRIGYNPNEFLGAQSGTKDTNVPNSKLAVKGITNSSDGFQTGGWTISESGDNLCMKNGTNPAFCVNKYGVRDNKKKIVFPWKNLCLDSSIIGTSNIPSSECGSNDNKLYYYTDLNGGNIRLASDPTKCLKIEDNKLVKRDCDINDEYQKFSKIGTVIYNYKSNKSIDISNNTGLSTTDYNSDSQESLLL